MTTLVRVVFALAALSQLCSAQTPSFRDEISAPSAEYPQISPDGSRVAYTTKNADWKADTYMTELWVYTPSTGEHKMLLKAESIDGAEWCADGHRIAYIGEQDGQSQIMLIDISGGAPSVLTKIKGGVEDFEVSPDGKHILYRTSADNPAMARRKAEQGDFTLVQRDESSSRMGILDVPRTMPTSPQEGRILLNDKFYIWAMTWSPDGGKVILRTRPGAAYRYQYSANLYVYDILKATLLKLAGPGFFGRPLWSPDGKSIAYTVAPDATLADFWIRDLVIKSAGGGPGRKVPIKFDEEIWPEYWSKKGIIFNDAVRLSERLFLVDPLTGKYRQLSPSDGHSREDYNFNRDGSVCTYMDVNATSWPKVVMAKVDPFGETQVPQTGTTHPALLPKRDVIWWKSKDVTLISGVLIKPKDFDPSKKYPLLVVIHGGPAGVSGPNLRRPLGYPVEQFVNRGAIVLEPNYRGSATFGAKFRNLIRTNMGIGESWDVTSGVDFLIKKGYVDTERMGCMGWSYGGYLTAFQLGLTHRFKAVSIGAAITDLWFYYSQSDT